MSLSICFYMYAYIRARNFLAPSALPRSIQSLNLQTMLQHFTLSYVCRIVVGSRAMLRCEPRSGSRATLRAFRFRHSSKLAHDDIGESRDVSSFNDQFWALIPFKAYHGSSSNDPHFVSPS